MHPQPTHPLPLLFHDSFFLISTEYYVYCPLTSCSGGRNLPRPPARASEWLLPFDCLLCACNRAWKRITMGKMVLVVICTGKCWPCCCFMYSICLYLTLGNLFSTVYRVRLQNGRSPSRIASLLSQATFSLHYRGVHGTSPSH